MIHLSGKLTKNLAESNSKQQSEPELSTNQILMSPYYLDDISTQGPLKGKLWRKHRITSLKDPISDEFEFRHFRNLTNSWNYDRSDWDASKMEEDDLLISTLSKVFETSIKLHSFVAQC